MGLLMLRTLVPHWGHEPEDLLKADQVSPDALWAAHQQAKRELIAVIENTVGVKMTPDAPLICFSRRMTGYKRPRVIEFREEVPVSNVGKILRRVLRDEEVEKQKT